jgi:NAD kinase
MEPRVVIVTRPTEYQGLLARHATHGQAAWYLEGQGQDIALHVERHTQQLAAIDRALRAIPSTWRHTRVARADLDRFLFEPEDIVVPLGQDGLVANVAKYLSGQPVIGVNPAPALYDGVLVRHPPEALADLLRSMDRHHPQHRTMIEARTGDGQRLLALNEIFVGHRSHQSARYTIAWRDRHERHSSSGVIVASGTGATGWAKSVHRCHRSSLPLPSPEARALAFFVREPWPSVSTGAELNEGLLQDAQTLTIASEMNDGGTLFGDGIEEDAIALDWALRATIGVADRALVLV